MEPDEFSDPTAETVEVVSSDDIVRCTSHGENPLDHIGEPIDHDPFSDYPADGA